MVRMSENKNKSPIKKLPPVEKDEGPATLMEGIGKMFAIIMLLLRGLAIAVICYFLYVYIEPLIT